MKQKLFTVFRICFAFALLFYLFYRIGLDQISQVLSSFNPYYLIALYILFSTDIVLRASNWKKLLRTKNCDLRIAEVLYNHLVGGFFGTFIPSSIGTDVARALMVTRKKRISFKDSASVMLVLNLIGLLALCIITFFSVFLLMSVIKYKTIIWVILPVCLTYVALFPLLMRGWMPDGRGFGLGRLDKLFSKIRNFSIALRAFRDHKPTLAGVLGVAFLNQTLGILIVYTVSLALHLNIPLIFFIAYVPMLTLSRLLPFSIAGLGAEQGIFVFLFAQADVPYAEAFLISLILSVTNISFALLGGGIYTLNNFYQLFSRNAVSIKK